MGIDFRLIFGHFRGGSRFSGSLCLTSWYYSVILSERRPLMTVKSSISLRDDQHAFAKTLVEGGRFPSVSAVVQQGLDLLRQQDADAAADRAALLTLLAERASGPFVPAGTLRAQRAERRAALSE
jgi:antitoxin ParD1/3/4